MIDKQPWRRNDYRPAVPGDGMTTDGVRIGGEWVRGVWWFALRPPAPRPSHYTLSMTAGGKRATLVLRAPRPTCTLRPRYGDVVMCEDFDPEAIRHIRPFRRGEQAQVFDHNLPRALAYYKQAQAADDAAPYPVSRGTLMRIYEVAHELGLTDEARAALARARDEYPWRTGYSWQQIASALKREGMSE
jgi:hypothetical protein